ncbi:MAG: S8 family serine peptidase [Phycicoccus sp.]
MTVAVVGSGIDKKNPQFRAGQVLPGRDVLEGVGPATDDCDGSGTFVAGLIGAQDVTETTVAGIAPAVTLLPVRVFQSVDGGSSRGPKPGVLADGIDYATGSGAEVIVVYEAATRSSDKLRKAVARANRAGIVVVAGGRSESDSEDAAELYPCGYPDVLGVAGVDPDGAALDGSCAGADVDLSAPGAQLVSTAAGGTGSLAHVPIEGAAPGYAAGYVGAAAALLRAHRPGMPVRELVGRLVRTAEPTPTGIRDDQLGWGLVDPYRAVSGVDALDAVGARTVASREVRIRPKEQRSTDIGSLALGGILLTTALAGATISTTVRNARKRGWRPGGRHTTGLADTLKGSRDRGTPAAAEDTTGQGDTR